MPHFLARGVHGLFQIHALFMVCSAVHGLFMFCSRFVLFPNVSRETVHDLFTFCSRFVRPGHPAPGTNPEQTMNKAEPAGTKYEQTMNLYYS